MENLTTDQRHAASPWIGLLGLPAESFYIMGDFLVVVYEGQVETVLYCKEGNIPEFNDGAILEILNLWVNSSLLASVPVVSAYRRLWNNAADNRILIEGSFRMLMKAEIMLANVLGMDIAELTTILKSDVPEQFLGDIMSHHKVDGLGKFTQNRVTEWEENRKAADRAAKDEGRKTKDLKDKGKTS